MRRSFIVWLAIGVSLLAAVPRPGRAGGAPDPSVVAKVEPAVVSITAVTYDLTGPIDQNMAGEPNAAQHVEQGSGFFVAPSGVIVTNRHPIAQADEILVTLRDGTRLAACLLATATQSDIALLRVNPGRPVPTLAFGDSERLRPGDPVFVVGNPLGHGRSVTAGIVGALDRNTAQSGFGSFFQTDAAINHGSSGAPVFDAAGMVVGVGTALFSPEGETGSVGLGLAIPSDDAQLIVGKLMADGRVRLGWIGAYVQAVTDDIAAAVHLPAPAGSIITAFHEDSPAARAGLVAGDIVLGIGEDGGRSPRTLNRAIAASTIGSVVRLAIWRDGAERTVPVVIGEAPPDKAPTKGTSSAVCAPARPARRDLGLVLGPLTLDLRRKLGIPAQQAGAAVIDVIANTAAADRGIAAGAVIAQINRRPVATPADVLAAIDAARAASERLVLLLVRDAQGLRWTAVPLGDRPGSDRAAQRG